MYGVVLLVALGGAGPASLPGSFAPWPGSGASPAAVAPSGAVPGAGCYGGFTGCPAPLRIVIPPGLPGGMIPLGGGPPPLVPEELQLWQKYLALLSLEDRSRVDPVWAAADTRRRRELIAEARKLIQEVEEERKPPAKATEEERKAPAKAPGASPTASEGDAEPPPLVMLPPPPASPARLIVELPAGAALSINGHQTRPGAPDVSRRVFNSPPLEPGRPYEYTLQARYLLEGAPVVVIRTVTVRAGQTSRVSLAATPTAFRRP